MPFSITGIDDQGLSTILLFVKHVCQRNPIPKSITSMFALERNARSSTLRW